MNYWHIRLHPNNKEAFPPEKVKKILTDTSDIGLGDPDEDWPGGKTQVEQFCINLKIGDRFIDYKYSSALYLSFFGYRAAYICSFN